MEGADVARWLGDYVEAWRTYDRGQIEALFSEQVEYRYHPYDEPVRGRDAVVASWLGEGVSEDESRRDDPGTYDAAYEPYAVDGDRAVAVGSSTYMKPDGSIEAIYDNCYLLRFDDAGRCSEFTEWFMERR